MSRHVWGELAEALARVLPMRTLIYPKNVLGGATSCWAPAQTHTYPNSTDLFMGMQLCSELQETFISIVSTNLYMFQGRYFYSFLFHKSVHWRSENLSSHPRCKISKWQGCDSNLRPLIPNWIYSFGHTNYLPFPSKDKLWSLSPQAVLTTSYEVFILPLQCRGFRGIQWLPGFNQA